MKKPDSLGSSSSRQCQLLRRNCRFVSSSSPSSTDDSPYFRFADIPQLRTCVSDNVLNSGTGSSNADTILSANDDSACFRFTMMTLPDSVRNSPRDPSGLSTRVPESHNNNNVFLRGLGRAANSVFTIDIFKSQVQNRGLLFCSVGLAGREIGSIEKLNLTRADSGFIPESGTMEKSSQHLDNGEAQRRKAVSERKQGKKAAMKDSAIITVKHLTAGAISAIVSRSVIAPLERLKLEYMVRGARQNVLRTIQIIILNEGIPGFWRGNVVNLLRTAPFKAVNYFCYDVYRKRLLELTGNKEVRNIERLVAGAAAGISATLLCFPMDTIRTVMVAPGGEALGGVVSCFQYMIRTEGFFSLYKGIWPAVISMAPSGAVFYGVYDILKTAYLESPEGQEDLRNRIKVERRRRGFEEKLETNSSMKSLQSRTQIDLKEEAGKLGQLELGPMRTLLYGAVAGVCAETATYPFEVVRRHLQMQNAASKMGALATVNHIVKKGGIGALYSGLLPSSLQVLPSAAISYFVYECLKVMLKVP